MFESMLSFPGSLFGEFDRLRREMDDLFGGFGFPASIRSAAPGAFPAVNVGSTPHSVDIYAFAPGLDPAKVEVTVDQGVLTLSGERAAALPDGGDGKVRVINSERPSGSFMRAISLPDDIDAEKVQAEYRNGLLHVSVARKESMQPRRITVQ